MKQVANGSQMVTLNPCVCARTRLFAISVCVWNSAAAAINHLRGEEEGITVAPVEYGVLFMCVLLVCVRVLFVAV